jgi:hypothetical protein
MKPRLTLITLGVDDLERSLRFYGDGLGFTTAGIIGREFEHGAVVFFTMQAGALIVTSARETFWGGYAGYFQDPDKHLWEVAWHPQWPVPE